MSRLANSDAYPRPTTGIGEHVDDVFSATIQPLYRRLKIRVRVQSPGIGVTFRMRAFNLYFYVIPRAEGYAHGAYAAPPPRADRGLQLGPGPPGVLMRP